MSQSRPALATTLDTMPDQGMPSLASSPQMADAVLSNSEKLVIVLLNLMGGPYLLCEHKVIETLRALPSLASILRLKKKPVAAIGETARVVRASDIRVEPETSGSNWTSNWAEVNGLLRNGTVYHELYRQTHNITHLEKALQSFQIALALCSVGHSKKDTVIRNLALSLEERYERTGDVLDLAACIRLQVERLALHPRGHPSRDDVLITLSKSLFWYFDRTGNIVDLEDATILQQECLELCPQGHPLRPVSLSNLAAIFSARYHLTGNLEYLEDVISLQRESLQLSPRGHDGRSTVLNNLASNLVGHYNKTGGPEDLEEAIALGMESVELSPPGHPTRDPALSNLAQYLRTRFDRVGNMEDLEGAISLQREGLELCTPWHRGRERGLNNLANYIFARYIRTGNPADLEEAIALQRESLDLCPLGYPRRDFNLSNLSVHLRERFDRVGNLEDLEEAITIQRECLELRPPGHPNRPSSLHNLASLLSERRDQKGNNADLEEAINFQRQSLELIRRGHPFRNVALNSLAVYLSTRYLQTDCADDLAEAIVIQRESLELCPQGRSSRATVLVHLADYLLEQVSRTRTPATEQNVAGSTMPRPIEASNPSGMTMVAVNEVVELLQEAAHHSLSATSERTRAANRWRMISSAIGHPSQLEAVKITLNLMDLAVAESTSLESLSRRLAEEESFKNAQGVASDAAALAIESGDLPLAVSLLEQGRSIIYSHLGRYRSPIDDVRQVSPELAARLVDLGVQLDALVVRGERIDSTSNFEAKPFDDDTSRHYNAHKAWVKTVAEIRRLPGLESFLLPSPFERLQEAAAEGPVVIVNINSRHSDAIIIYATGDPTLVPLPNASPEAVQTVIDGFGERPAECTSRKAIGFLREIWAIIVEPIAAQLLLALAGRSDKPRIWWCPTGVASKLPLHAAGPYVRGKLNINHIFVSSYTPTLGTLIRARQTKAASITEEGSKERLLIVGQPETPGENPLPNVVNEVQAIKKQVRDASVLLASDGTKESVLEGIRENAWVHLACHGHYDTKQPFHSSFAMHDGPVTLLELIGKDLPEAELAFLSACHSARVSETLPDEALHPAAGMMFAGFKSVIGTMWAFDDGVGSALAGRFYELMVAGGKVYVDAAVVLAEAIEDIVAKDKDAVPFMQRINVVHYGV